MAEQWPPLETSGNWDKAPRAAAPAPAADATSEAREQIARWFAGTIQWTAASDAIRQDFRDDADHLIKSCRAVAEALAAVERVRALAEDDEQVARMAREREKAAKVIGEQNYWHTLAGVREQSAERLRRTLDGEQKTPSAPPGAFRGSTDTRQATPSRPSHPPAAGKGNL